MKKILLFITMAVLTIGLVNARGDKNENVKSTVFVTDIHCEGCSTKIMNNVPALGKGVKDVQINLVDKTVTVTFDTEKNSDERIIKGFKSLGVEAEPVVEPKEKKECTNSCCEKKEAQESNCCKP